MKCPVDQKDIFLALMDQTANCVARGGDPLQCETAYLSAETNFTFHTHPNDVPYPSDIDIQTTKGYGKEYLCIGLVNEKRTICFSKDDGYQNIVCEF